MSPTAPPLTRADTGAWLWQHLRAAFPRAIAATLMPDHPHVVLASRAPEACRIRLARLLGQFGRCFGVQGQVSLVPAPAVIRGGTVLARQVRYVALNPCREGLAACPLAWMWSTHRDVVGAAVDPWVTAERLAGALRCSPSGFAARNHAYVSGDPDADVHGTPLPRAAVPTAMPSLPLRDIADAATAALRLPRSAIHGRGDARALFIALAFDQGWDHVARLASVCGCSPKTIRRHAAAVDEAALAVARLCLGDPRLRRRPDDHARDASGRPGR